MVRNGALHLTQLQPQRHHWHLHSSFVSHEHSWISELAACCAALLHDVSTRWRPMKAMECHGAKPASMKDPSILVPLCDEPPALLPKVLGLANILPTSHASLSCSRSGAEVVEHFKAMPDRHGPTQVTPSTGPRHVLFDAERKSIGGKTRTRGRRMNPALPSRPIRPAVTSSAFTALCPPNMLPQGGKACQPRACTIRKLQRFCQRCGAIPRHRYRPLFGPALSCRR